MWQFRCFKVLESACLVFPIFNFLAGVGENNLLSDFSRHIFNKDWAINKLYTSKMGSAC